MSDPKVDIDRKNVIYITEDIVLVPPATQSGFGTTTTVASGIQLHFPIVSGELLLTSGAGIRSSGSGLAINPTLWVSQVNVSGTLLMQSGAIIRGSGSTLTIAPDIPVTLHSIANGAVINTPTISGIFNGGLSGNFTNAVISNTLTVTNSGVFGNASVSGTILSTTGVFGSLIISGRTHISDHIDFTRISIPSDPSATIARLYHKQIDTDNDGIFVKVKRAGSIVEVRIV